MFLGCPELAWRRKMAGHFSYLTLRQSSTIPKNTDARFPKSFNAHQWIRRAQFSQARVILKREPAPIKSQQTAVQTAEKDKCCLSGVHPVAVIAWKASSFVPDVWTKKLFASNNRRTKDVACDSWAEGCCDWFLRVPGVFAPFWATKRRYKN